MRPPKRPRTRTGVHCAAATTPRMSGSLVRVRTSQAWATDCIQEPAREIAWPPKKRRKLRWRRARRAFTFVTPAAVHGPASACGAPGTWAGAPPSSSAQVGAQVRPARLGCLEHRPEAVGLLLESRDLAIHPVDEVAQDRPLLGRLAGRPEALAVPDAGLFVLEEQGDLGQAEAGVVPQLADEPEPLQVGGVVEPVGALRTRGRAEEADLLVVADGARRQAGRGRHLLDPRRRGAGTRAGPRQAAVGAGRAGHGGMIPQP